MKKSSAYLYIQHYFAATRDHSWLARLCDGLPLKMLEELMQWELTPPASDD